LKKKTMVIGLTGSPMAGKSEVAAILARKGAGIIKADIIGHKLLEKNRTIRKKLLKLFGNKVLDNNDNFNRSTIGDIVFNDYEMLQSYNRIIHPPLLRQLKKDIREFSERQSLKMIVVDAALIFEWGIADWFDIIIVVSAKKNIIIKRFLDKGFKRWQAERRLASQLPQKEKISLADYVIENNFSPADLRKQVIEFVRKLNEMTDKNN
jgi:dephospho-CoA kinase